MGKIVIFGDSITYGKWDNRGGWAERLREEIDKEYNIGKGGNVQVYNMGIPGEVSTRMLDRVKLELSMRIDTESQNVVLFAIGINDSNPQNWMSGKQTPEEELKSSLTQMIKIAKDMKARVALIGLTPVNEDNLKEVSGFKNDYVETYDKYVADVASEQGVPVLDLYNPLNNDKFKSTLGDGVHPSAEGHQMMFEKIYEFLVKEKLIEYCTEN